MPSPSKTLRTGGTLKRAFRDLIGRSGYVPLRTGRRGGTFEQVERFPNPPANWGGTLPEWAIYWAHLRLGLKENEDFEYLQRLRYVGGTIKGVQVDFLELDLPIAIDIQGVFFHYGFGQSKITADQETRSRVEAVGLTYIAIDEEDAINDPIFYLKEARLGKEHSRIARGVV